ncbi:MAG: ATPase AAA [Candidatus Sumerlaea sp.]|nr:MAG: ATPase AAA [Candidatus Sumerlaea sp.]
MGTTSANFHFVHPAFSNRQWAWLPIRAFDSEAQRYGRNQCMDLLLRDDDAARSRPEAPLAERMRPRTLDEFVGQDDVVGPNSALRRLIEEDRLRSLIFWGPPGCGKTTLALIVARVAHSDFASLSAVTASIREVKEVMERARINRNRYGRRTLLFIDEIHRFNKAQQDAFLPFVEDGSILLIGATTENPSFSLIAPLLSRCEVIVLHQLSAAALRTILRRALQDMERGLGSLGIECSDDVLDEIARLADGDARRALNLLEMAAQIALTEKKQPPAIERETLSLVLRRTHLLYDKSGEEHYNLISALHKSLRASDVQAAIYWAMRMLTSGEDPLYIARRLIRFASEDVGNADPQALSVALAAREAYSVLGSPEGELALLQCVVYLATAPKSNSLYVAEARAREEIERSGSLPVPLHLRNAPTELMERLGYGAGYVYDHEAPDHFSGQECLPEALRGRVFYEPGTFGFEREIAKRMAWWEKQRQTHRTVIKAEPSAASEEPSSPAPPEK